MLDGWAAARTQQVRLGKAGTDALLDHLEAWCPTHRDDKLADVILAWRRQHANRGRMLPAVSCAGWYAPATPITGNEQQLALSLWLAGHALGRAGLEVPLQDQRRLDRIFALFDSGERPPAPVLPPRSRGPRAPRAHGRRPGRGGAPRWCGKGGYTEKLQVTF